MLLILMEAELRDALLQLARSVQPASGPDCSELSLVRGMLCGVAQESEDAFARCKAYPLLRQALDSYYLSVCCERVLWESPLLTRDDFVACFVFVFDVALRSGRQEHIRAIMGMPETQQLVLQPFLAEIAGRAFVEAAVEPDRSHLFDLEEENDRLRAERDELARRHQQLKESYDYLKQSHDGAQEEVNLLKQERYQLINELGGSECGSVDETIEKVRRELAEAERQHDRLQRQLDDKAAQLDKKQQQLEAWESRFKANRYEEKSLQLDQLLVSERLLRDELGRHEARLVELQEQVERERESCQEKDRQLGVLGQQVAGLLPYERKYSQIRALHGQFKARLSKEHPEQH